MLNTVLAKVFGTQHEREIKALRPLIASINELEPRMQELSDEELAAQTVLFRQQLASGATLDDLLVPAFATVREAGRRILNMRHFDVQLIGGAVLHRGKIAEMKTGEGKTLVATLPVYLNALAGKGVHVVTVNDYLAKRDAEWMGKIYEFLGLKVGVIVHDLDDAQRREAYAADITYGTNNEFGFDYLRDNMKFELADCVQRGHYYGIVDEVDSILIDEARTPLIISGPTDQTTDKYARVNRIIPQLEQGEEIEKGETKILTGDYVVDEKHKTISVTDEGWEKIEGLLGIGNIADPENWDFKHHVETAIKAHNLYRNDVEYVVKDGEVIIIDTFTGRPMPGRRWSDGLHQAVEAKEGVNIRREDQTLATITFQNYFRMYKKLAGMTGTAETEAAEFDKTYKLEIVVIPTNMPMRRKEFQDVVYRTAKEKYFAVSDEIIRLNEEKQPVLVGTTSIEKSELLSQILQRKGVKHVVLNAKYEEREAEIVAQAGRLGMVTIATNMAGRGTDILLGGNAEFVTKQDLVKRGQARSVSAAEGAITPTAGPGMMRFYYQGQEFETSQENWDRAWQVHQANTQREHEEVLTTGGLCILGTERHESRRIDNQLRGRAGRQGDPGASRFYLSLEDDLMRIFAREWVGPLLQRMGMDEGVPIESGMITRRIEGAQKAVESQNFEARKHLLEGVEQKELILEDYVAGIISNILDEFAPESKHPDQWDLAGLKQKLMEHFGFNAETEGIAFDTLNRHELGDTLFDKLKEKYELKEQIIGSQGMRYHERMIMLSVLDGLWKDHLLNMDHLKEGIGLRGYGQQDPLVAYKKESFDMFEGMMTRFQEDTVRYLFMMQIVGQDGQPITRPIQQQPVQQALPAQPLQQPLPELNGHGVPPVPQPQHVQSPAPKQTWRPMPVGDTRTPDVRSGDVRNPETRGGETRTTIDEIEREFARKKKRELEQARAASTNGNGAAPVEQRRTGEKVGRNDPGPCGSGLKSKKCHGKDSGDGGD